MILSGRRKSRSCCSLNPPCTFLISRAFSIAPHLADFPSQAASSAWLLPFMVKFQGGGLASLCMSFTSAHTSTLAFPSWSPHHFLVDSSSSWIWQRQTAFVLDSPESVPSTFSWLVLVSLLSLLFGRFPHDSDPLPLPPTFYVFSS